MHSHVSVSVTVGFPNTEMSHLGQEGRDINGILSVDMGVEKQPQAHHLLEVKT